MKTLKTILLINVFLSATILWLTREDWLPSLSAFALSTNAMWYRMMHISAIGYFLINAVQFKKYATEFALAGGMALILIFDMYNTPTLHNVFTVATLVAACATLFINSPKIPWYLATGVTVGAFGTFAYGYYSDFHFLLAEIIAMAFVTGGKLFENYKSE